MAEVFFYAHFRKIVIGGGNIHIYRLKKPVISAIMAHRRIGA